MTHMCSQTSAGTCSSDATYTLCISSSYTLHTCTSWMERHDSNRQSDNYEGHYLRHLPSLTYPSPHERAPGATETNFDEARPCAAAVRICALPLVAAPPSPALSGATVRAFLWRCTGRTGAGLHLWEICAIPVILMCSLAAVDNERPYFSPSPQIKICFLIVYSYYEKSIPTINIGG